MLTISKFESVILTPRSFLFFLIFWPLQGHLACFGQYGHTGCSPQAGSPWSTRTGAHDIAVCARSHKMIKFAFLFTARACDSEVILFEDYTRWQWLWFTARNMRHYKLCHHILWKGCERESEDAESFEINCQVQLRAFSWISEWMFFFSIIPGQKKRKQ